MNLIQQIKAAQKYAHICDDSHRKNVLQVSNYRVSTCTKLTVAEQNQLLRRYRSMNTQTLKQGPLPPELKHIYRLWGLLAKAGLVNVDSKQACDTFCQKHTDGLPLNTAKAHWSRLIEILKAWLNRGDNHAV